MWAIMKMDELEALNKTIERLLSVKSENQNPF
jgi:hypothetical protein